MAKTARKTVTGTRTPVSVRFSKEDEPMVRLLRARARASKRSLSEQIKYYAHLGIVAKENPDLPLGFIEGILEGLEESRAGLVEPYHWGRVE
jgi:hypothetical protein